MKWRDLCSAVISFAVFEAIITKALNPCPLYYIGPQQKLFIFFNDHASDRKDIFLNDVKIPNNKRINFPLNL